MGSNFTDDSTDFLAQVERRSTAVEDCDGKNGRTSNEKVKEEDHRVEVKSDRAHELQIQIPPQMQQTDTRIDR